MGHNTEDHVSDSTQGNSEPKSDHGEGEANKPVAMTAEQVNAAITARFKSLEKKVEESVGTMLTGFTSKLTETMTAQFDALKPKETPVVDKAKDATKAEDPAVKQLREELAAMKQQNHRIDSERKAERAKARDATLRNSLSSALTSAGIPAPLAKKAVFELVDGTKRVSWQSEESDALVFKADDGEAYDLDTGLRSWLGTEDAKFYKPATGTTGSGARPGTPGGGKPAPTPQEKTLELLSQHMGLNR